MYDLLIKFNDPFIDFNEKYKNYNNHTFILQYIDRLMYDLDVCSITRMAYAKPSRTKTCTILSFAR